MGRNLLDNLGFLFFDRLIQDRCTGIIGWLRTGCEGGWSTNGRRECGLLLKVIGIVYKLEKCSKYIPVLEYQLQPQETGNQISQSHHPPSL